MEDFKFDLILGQGPQARTIEMPLPRFTLVGDNEDWTLMVRCVTVLVLLVEFNTTPTTLFGSRDTVNRSWSTLRDRRAAEMARSRGPHG